MFRNLRTISIFLVFLFLLNNAAYADKFPKGYPECWKDTKNAIDTNGGLTNNINLLLPVLAVQMLLFNASAGNVVVTKNPHWALSVLILSSS